MTTLKFDEWQDVGGTPVLRINAGVLEIWDGAEWSEAGGAGPAEISGTTGSPDVATTGEAYVFTGSGSITVDKAGYADVLIIGGGGGGYGGAGGAGGFYEQTVWLDEGTHTVTVGAGGQAGYQANYGGGVGPRDGFNGGSSFLGDVYVSPGGGGGCNYRSNTTSSNNYTNAKGRTGGSGGGGGSTNYTNATDSFGEGISGFGNNGGRGGFLTGGGGGGAGAVGENGGVNYPNGSHGGDGSISTIISSTDAVSFSVGQLVTLDVYYAGGGGGSPYSGPGGNGGLGGGGTNGAAGTANTGGGGASGGAGGSGVVIVRIS